MAYRPGFWHISQDFDISSTFGISARILTYQPGFCTVFHCSTNPFVPSSIAVQWQRVSIRYLESQNPSLSSQNKKTTVLSIHDPCRHPGVSVLPHALYTLYWRRDAPSTCTVMLPASHRDARRAERMCMRGMRCRHVRPTAPSATGRAATFSDDISVYKPTCMDIFCCLRTRLRSC